MPVCGPSLFGPAMNYIKVGNGEFVAVEGATTAERLILKELRIPYKQLIKSKILLKKGQENYLLKYLGDDCHGDSATFVAIKATYDAKSVIEEDNYLNWSYFDDINRVNKMAQMMVLTGNSSNRIPQLYLSNPNEKYDVQLEVMIAVIDDETFFNYSPIVYFTEEVSIANVEYNGPYNTSLGDNFEAKLNLNYYYYNLTIPGIIYLLIDNLKDSNGVDVDIQDTYFELFDDEDNLITEINAVGEYYLKFNFTDSLGYSIDSEKNIKITVTDD